MKDKEERGKERREKGHDSIPTLLFPSPSADGWLITALVGIMHVSLC